MQSLTQLTRPMMLTIRSLCTYIANQTNSVSLSMLNCESSWLGALIYTVWASRVCEIKVDKIKVATSRLCDSLSMRLSEFATQRVCDSVSLWLYQSATIRVYDSAALRVCELGTSRLAMQYLACLPPPPPVNLHSSNSSCQVALTSIYRRATAYHGCGRVDMYVGIYICKRAFWCCMNVYMSYKVSFLTSVV